MTSHDRLTQIGTQGVLGSITLYTSVWFHASGLQSPAFNQYGQRKTVSALDRAVVLPIYTNGNGTWPLRIGANVATYRRWSTSSSLVHWLGLLMVTCFDSILLMMVQSLTWLQDVAATALAKWNEFGTSPLKQCTNNTVMGRRTGWAKEKCPGHSLSNALLQWWHFRSSYF